MSAAAVVVQFGLRLSPNDRNAQFVASPMSLVVWIRPKYPYVKVFVPTKLGLFLHWEAGFVSGRRSFRRRKFIMPALRGECPCTNVTRDWTLVL